MDESIENYEIAIIGGGPAGYVGAIRAAQLGKKVCLIEEDKLGGTCLWKGCIPTKVLLHSSDLYQKFLHAADLGIILQGIPKPDLSIMMQRKDQILSILGTGIKSLLKSYKIPVFCGRGTFKNSRTIEIHSSSLFFKLITADNILICTGSHPTEIHDLSYNGKTILSTNDILELKDIPHSLIILGGGYTGVEFGFLFAELGTEVTLIEMMPQPLPQDDHEIIEILLRQMRKKKIRILTSTRILAIDQEDGSGIKVHLSIGEAVRADKLLVSVGRSLNYQGLGLSEIGIKQGHKGEILVNEHMETSIPGIYAAGDITGKLLLAHVASAQAVAAIENICGENIIMDYSHIPSCTFCHPPIARAGLTEEQCHQMKKKIKIGKYLVRGLGAVQVTGELDGLIKIIANEKTDEILGIHMICKGATEIIHEAVLAMEKKITAREFGKYIRAHPSLSETLMEAARDIHQESFHIPWKDNP